MCLKGIEPRMHTKEIEALKTVPAAVPAAVTLSRAGVVVLTPTLSTKIGVVFPPEDETDNADT